VLEAIMASALALSSFSETPREIGVQAISGGERVPFEVVIIAPHQSLAASTRAAVYKRASELLEQETKFRLVEIDSDGAVAECQDNLGCIVLAARSELAPVNDTVFDEPAVTVEEAKRRVQAAHPRARYLTILWLRTAQDGTDQVNAFLIDCDQALTTYLELQREGMQRRREPGDGNRVDPERFEDRMSGRALRMHSGPFAFGSEGAWDAALHRILLQDVKKTLSASSDWSPFGAIEVDGAPSGTSVQLDGKVIGVADGRRVRISSVSPGSRTLAFERPGYARSTLNVNVAAAESANVELALLAEREKQDLAHTIALWSGVGIATVGVTVLAFAIARAASPTAEFVCITGGGSTPSCGSPGFIKTSQSFGVTEIRSSGVMIAPLGYSLALAGGTWTAGTLLTDEDQLPWLAILLGVAAGAASYVLSAALEPHGLKP
jgi:hypothetical protein